MENNVLPPPKDAVHLKCHTRWVNSISVLPEGGRIATASSDKTVRIFSLSSAGCLRSFHGHGGSVLDVKAIDVDTVVSVHWDRALRVWRISDGQLVHSKRTSYWGACCASLGGLQLVAGGNDCHKNGVLHLLQWTGSQLANLGFVSPAHSKEILHIAVHNGRFATASSDKTAKLWDAATLTCLHTFSGHLDRVLCVALNDQFVITGSCDKTIRVYDAQSFRFLRSITAHSKLIRNICLVHGGDHVLSGSYDRTIAAHELGSGKCRWRMRIGIKGHALAVLPDGRVAAACRDKSDVRIFSTPLCKHMAQVTQSSYLASPLARIPAVPHQRVAAAGKGTLEMRASSTASYEEGRQSAQSSRPANAFVRTPAVSQQQFADTGNGTCEVKVSSTTLSEDEQQVVQSSRLATAYACALADPAVLDESFLHTHICADNINTTADLLAGHNLILLSIRFGVISRDNIDSFGGSSWFLKDNLYLPATKIDTEDPKLIHFIFHHAESLDIISGGYALKIAQEIRSDVKAGAKIIIEAITALSERVSALERRTSTLEGNAEELHVALSKMHMNERTLQQGVLSLSQSLTDLQNAIRSQDRKMRYAGIARCMLSFIPLVGNAIGNTAYTATNMLMNLTAEQLVSAGVDAAKSVVDGMASVDLSNFQVARYVFSQSALAQLEPPVKDAIMQAISGSSFNTIQALQSDLYEQVSSTSSLDAPVALLDIGSSSWLNAPSEATESSSDEGNGLDESARKYFQYLTHRSGCEVLTVVSAKEELNHLLRGADGLSEVSPRRLEDLYFELADDDDEDVSEDVFVAVFRAVREEQGKAKKAHDLLCESSTRFRKRADDDGSVPLRVAARVLRNVYKDMERGGLVEAGSFLEFGTAQNELRRFCARDNESIEEEEFLSAVKSFWKEN